MICTGFAPEDNAGSVSAGKYDGVGESVLTLQNRIANWGTPWHNVGNIDMGFPILEWQLDRGDYASYGGHDNSEHEQSPYWKTNDLLCFECGY